MEETESSETKLSYCGQCRRCVRLSEFFLPIQAIKKEKSGKVKHRVTIGQQYSNHAMLK